MLKHEEVYRMIRNNPEAVVQLRLRIIKELESGKSVRQVAREFNASPSTIQRIKRRYEEGGIEGLYDRSRRPRRMPRKTPEHLEQEVLNLALREPTYGRIRIAGDMEHPVSSWTVRHILRRLREQGKLPPRGKKTSRKGYREERSVQQWREEVGLKDAVWVQVDRKTIADKKALGKERYEHLKRKGFPLYQWTALVEDCRLRLLAFSHRGTQDEGRLFLALTVAWLRLLGVRKPIVLQTDHGTEFGWKGEKKVRGPWEIRDLGAMGGYHVRYPVGKKEWNGRVERSHRTDDEEFYRRRLLEFGDMDAFLKGALEWVVKYNVRRKHYGVGMKGRTPLERFYEIHGCPEVVDLPVVMLDDLATLFVLTYLPWPHEGECMHMCWHSTRDLDVSPVHPYTSHIPVPP